MLGAIVAMADVATRSSNGIPRVAFVTMTRAAFREYQRENQPVIITGVTERWRAAEWVDSLGRPDVESLRRLFGGDEVTVHDGGHGTREMTVAGYASWWASRGGEEALLYLKDWHLAALHPQYEAYEVPLCLGEDWLNEHWQSPEQGQLGGGDHRFVYVGPRGSATALHADVLFSYSWSVNVVGRKRWRLVPASERRRVTDAGTQPLARWLREVPVAAGAPAVPIVEVVQEEGELLFVPSGWYHEVENLDDCISINHNWLGAHAAHWPLVRLRETLDDVRSGLDDEDAHDLELLDDLLERRCGLGMFGWAALLEGIVRRRLPGTALPGTALRGTAQVAPEPALTRVTRAKSKSEFKFNSEAEQPVTGGAPRGHGAVPGAPRGDGAVPGAPEPGQGSESAIPGEDADSEVAYARTRAAAVLRETLDWIESCAGGDVPDGEGLDSLEPHRHETIRAQRALVRQIEELGTAGGEDVPALKRRRS